MLLIRHAESEWNRVFGPTRVDAGLPDPGLTDAGAAATHAAVGALRELALTAILSSPYTRALQTAAILGEALGLPIAVTPEVRERCAFSCDQGRPAAVLRERWPGLDLANLDERWWGSAIESMESLDRRAIAFKVRAALLPDRDRTLVVTHWGFIRSLTGAEVHNLTALRLEFG